MLKMLHSGWAYITLLILIIAVANAIIGLSSKKEFKEKDLRIPLFALIVSHIQLLIGFIAFFTSTQFEFLRENGMGEVMKESDIRMVVIEHPLMMIIAAVLLVAGSSGAVYAFSKHSDWGMTTEEKVEFISDRVTSKLDLDAIQRERFIELAEMVVVTLQEVKPTRDQHMAELNSLASISLKIRPRTPIFKTPLTRFIVFDMNASTAFTFVVKVNCLNLSCKEFKVKLPAVRRNPIGIRYQYS